MSEGEQQISKKEMKKQRKEEKLLHKQSEAKRKMMIQLGVALGIIILIGALIAGVLLTRESAGNIKDQTPDPVAGKADSQVVVRAYEDLQCPACAATHPVVKDLMKQYGDRVKFVFNDYPLPQHKNATVAAVAAQCALEQNKYFELADILFTRQADWETKTNKGAQEKIRAYAEGLEGMDMTAFDSCVTDERAANAVKEDIYEGNSLGVQGTPSFFVNDKQVSKTPFSQTLKAAIDEALQAQAQ